MACEPFSRTSILRPTCRSRHFRCQRDQNAQCQLVLCGPSLHRTCTRKHLRLLLTVDDQLCLRDLDCRALLLTLAPLHVGTVRPSATCAWERIKVRRLRHARNHATEARASESPYRMSKVKLPRPKYAHHRRRRRHGTLRPPVAATDLSRFGLLGAVTHRSREIDDHDRVAEFDAPAGGPPTGRLRAFAGIFPGLRVAIWSAAAHGPGGPCGATPATNMLTERAAQRSRHAPTTSPGTAHRPSKPSPARASLRDAP